MEQTPRQTTGLIKMVLSDPSLKEFRCDCGALLLKGYHLEKAVFQVKCSRCGAMVVNVGFIS